MSGEFSRRDADIIRHMARYCGEIDAALTAFGDSEEGFLQNPVFRNAVSMPVQQIGELAKHLSDDFLAAHPQIPWRQIKGMRDWFAHQYLGMDAAVIWAVAKEDLPPLRAFCEEWLQAHQTD